MQAKDVLKSSLPIGSELLDEGALLPFAPTRSKRSVMHFSAAFRLREADEPLPPGAYEIVVDEELIEGTSHLAYRRVATPMRLPAIGVRTNIVQLVPVDAQDLEHALERDHLAIGGETSAP